MQIREEGQISYIVATALLYITTLHHYFTSYLDTLDTHCSKELEISTVVPFSAYVV